MAAGLINEFSFLYLIIILVLICKVFSIVALPGIRLNLSGKFNEMLRLPHILLEDPIRGKDHDDVACFVPLIDIIQVLLPGDV